MLSSTSTFSMSNAALHNHGISGSGSLHNTSAIPTGPSHREPASKPSWRLHPRSSQDARTIGGSTGPANDGIQTATVVLTTQLPLSSRDSPAVTTEDSRPLSTRTRPEPPAPASPQDARTRIAGSTSPSEYYPVSQTFGDRVTQGIPVPRSRTHLDPPGPSATSINPPANSRIPFSTVHSDLPSPPTTPQGNRPTTNSPSHDRPPTTTSYILEFDRSSSDSEVA